MIVLSLFDGMSCGQIALRDMGITIEKYYASEVDKFAIQNTMHNFPDTVQLGDVRNIDARTLGHIDFLIGGSPCFAAGTKVLTSEGYKDIEDIEVGDYVLTHQNRYRRVLRVGRKEAAAYNLKASGFVDTVCTANHPFYARKKRRVAYIQASGKRSYKIEAGEPEWIEAQHLSKRYYVACNVESQESDNPLKITEEEAWVIGRYIADGHTRKDLRFDHQKDGSRGHNGSRAWQLILSIGNDKVEQFKSHFKDLHYSCYPHGDSVHRFVFSNKRLVQIVESECGVGSINKCFGEAIIKLPKHLLHIVLYAFLEGDGYKNDRDIYHVTTISKMLVVTMQRVVSKLYNRHINVTYFKPEEYRELCGRIVHQNPRYVIRFSPIKGSGVEKARFIGDKIWRNVKAFEPIGERRVFNLEVEDDNSYTANNLIVHNCQSFSFAGKRAGMSTKEKEEIYTLDRYLELKQAGFEFEGQSYLFWEYVRILHELRESNPKVLFLLENVEMGKKWETVLSEAVGIRGVHINSKLVSAQMRKRIYWTNIRTKPDLLGNLFTDIPQPVDRGLYLSDILEDEVDERYYITDTVFRNLLAHKERNEKNGRGYGMVVKFPEEKSIAVRVGGKGMYDIVCGAMRGRYNEERGGNCQQLEVRKDKKSNTLTTVQNDNIILQRPRGRKGITAYSGKSPTLTSNAWEQNNILHRRIVAQLNTSTESNGKQPYQQHRVYSVDGISPALCSSRFGRSPLIIAPGDILRRMTPTECARLQTIPEWYKWGCSATQQYKMLGNGWTVEVIKHIFSFLPDELKE